MTDIELQAAEIAELTKRVAALSDLAERMAREKRDQRIELQAEIERLRTALCEIANSDMTTSGFQMMASEALSGGIALFNGLAAAETNATASVVGLLSKTGAA